MPGSWLEFKAVITSLQKGRKERISLPIHGNKDLKVSLLKHFMKLAGLKESDI